MAQNGGGSIINIASDLSVISPYQKLYEKNNVEPDLQPVKPVNYSVIKSGLHGLTLYMSTYWADKNVRSNTFHLVEFLMDMMMICFSFEQTRATGAHGK